VGYYLSTITGGVKSVPRAAQVRVMKAQQALARVTGMDPASLAAELAEQPAIAKQLVNTAEREGAVMQLNSTLKEHGNILKDVAKGVQQTGSPLFNGPVREWKRKLAGSPELKRFNIAINALEREYGRLTSSPLSKGQLPVDTSKHMQKIFSDDSSLEEIAAEVDQVQVEGAAEERAMGNAREKIKGMLKSSAIGQAVGAPGGDQNIPVVRSQADFDKLPKGAIFMEDGKKYKKP